MKVELHSQLSSRHRPHSQRSGARKPSTGQHLLCALALVASLGLGACTKVSKSSPNGPETLIEFEPNDFAEDANFFGTLRPGDSLVIEGDLGFGADEQDGFAFVTKRPCEIEFVLTAQSANAGFGVCIFEPDFNYLTYCFDAAANPQVGAISVHSYDYEVHLLPFQLFGAAGYTLTINVFELGYYPGPSTGDSQGDSLPENLQPVVRAQVNAPSAAITQRLQDYYSQTEEAIEPDVQLFRALGNLLVLDTETGELQHGQVLVPQDPGLKSTQFE